MEIEIKEKIDSLEITKNCMHNYFSNTFDLFLIYIL